MVLTVAFDYGSRAELRRTPSAGCVAERHADHTGERSASTCTSPSCRPSTCSCARRGERRVSNFMLWQIAGAAVYFTDKAWPDFDAAELDAALALVACSVEASERESRREASTRWRLSPPRSPAPRIDRGQREMAEPVGGRDRVAAATSSSRPAPEPARRSPTSCPAVLVGQAGRRRHGHQGAAGPARRQGPAVPRRSTSAGRSTGPCSRGAATTSACSACARCNAGEPQGQLEIEELAPRDQGRDQAARPVGRHDRRPATRPSSTWSPSDAAVARGQRRQRRVPWRRPLPDGRAVLRRAGPRRGRRRRRGRRQHPPLRPPRRQRRHDPARARRRRVRRGPPVSKTS